MTSQNHSDTGFNPLSYIDIFYSLGWRLCVRHAIAIFKAKHFKGDDNMGVKTLKIVPNDKGVDEVVNPKHVKVKAKNEPEIGKEETVSNMPDGSAPTGKEN